MAHTYSFHGITTDYPVGMKYTKVDDETVAITIGQDFPSIDYVIADVQLYLTIEQLVKLHATATDALTAIGFIFPTEFEAVDAELFEEPPSELRSLGL